MYVLGTELRPFARAASALDHWTVSQPLGKNPRKER